MVLVGDDFYVADTDAILRFPYFSGVTEINMPGVKVADLPAGSINYHWTKDLTASPDGSKLYATVGSNSNVGENGMEAEAGRADVLEIDRASGKARVFASGLRNPNGPSWQPQSGALWVTVNERDELGNDLVPDYMTSLRDDAFYGWPYSYFGDHVDDRVSAATARSGVESDRAGLCAGRAYRFARPHLQYWPSLSRLIWRAAPSSANTAPGTGSRAPVTR